MSSSPEGSPTSASAGSGRTFSMSRDKFSIDLASPRLQLVTNGTTINGTNGNRLNSPSIKSPAGARRMASFSRDGILGSAQKARNLSQSSGDREQIVSGLHGRHQTNGSANGNGNSNGNGNGNSNNNNTSDDGINPLKRRSTDAGIDYPRRRATIAVSEAIQIVPFLANRLHPVRDMPITKIEMRWNKT